MTKATRATATMIFLVAILIIATVASNFLRLTLRPSCLNQSEPMLADMHNAGIKASHGSLTCTMPESKRANAR